MEYRILFSCLKSANKYNFIRELKSPVNLRLLPYSTKSNLEEPLDVPVKYTTSPASNTSIAENLKLHPKYQRPPIQRFAILASLVAFLVYFCILREENDIDEMLKGNPSNLSDQAKYLQLKLMLEYCKKNHLPRGEVEAKIREYEKKLNIPSKYFD